MNSVFIIEQLQICGMENQYNYAVTYDKIGFVESLEKARQVISDMGLHNGTGWPVSKGETIPNGKFEEVKRLSLNASNDKGE